MQLLNLKEGGSVNIVVTWLWRVIKQCLFSEWYVKTRPLINACEFLSTTSRDHRGDAPPHPLLLRQWLAFCSDRFISGKLCPPPPRYRLCGPVRSAPCLFLCNFYNCSYFNLVYGFCARKCSADNNVLEVTLICVSPLRFTEIILRVLHRTY